MKVCTGRANVRAIAWSVGVEESVAFAAAGQSFPGPSLADELPPGADNLSPKSRKAVVAIVRVLVDLEAGNSAERTRSEPTKISWHLNHGVAPESNIGPEQKTGPDNRVIEIHGAEAEKYPAPPMEQIDAQTSEHDDQSPED